MDVLSVQPLRPTRSTRGDRRDERRRLARCDALSSRLAELSSIQDLLDGAAQVVRHGWVQQGWFRVATPGGHVVVTAYDVRLLRKRPVTGACLVGAVVHVAGGPAKARTQLVQRTLDLTWRVLYNDDDVGPPRVSCSSPQVRTMRVQDLTRWNDAPARTQGQVVGLLVGARRFRGHAHRRLSRRTVGSRSCLRGLGAGAPASPGPCCLAHGHAHDRTLQRQHLWPRHQHQDGCPVANSISAAATPTSIGSTPPRHWHGSPARPSPTEAASDDR